jgi:hypothetical protein
LVGFDRGNFQLEWGAHVSARSAALEWSGFEAESRLRGFSVAPIVEDLMPSANENITKTPLKATRVSHACASGGFPRKDDSGFCNAFDYVIGVGFGLAYR